MQNKQNMSRAQMREKKILYLITQSELGGVQRYVFDLATNLNQEFDISVAFGEQGEKGELVKQLKQANIEYYVIPYLKRAISPMNDLKALIEIIKLIKKTKPNIIHLNSSKISILGSMASLFSKFQISNFKFQTIYTVHGWVFNEPMPKWKKTFYKYAEKFTALFKDKLICVSGFDKQTAIKEKIAPEKKLITIHNGIKPIQFLSKEQAKEKLSSQITPLPSASPLSNGRNTGNIPLLTKEGSGVVIGTIANLYKTKGLEYLIEAIYILKEKFLLPCLAGRQVTSDFLLLIIGEGEERKNLEDLIGQFNLKSNIILTGRIDNAAQLLPAFDIYACPSVKEGLSYTVIEAMQAGLPIVATNVGGNPELIENNQTGLLTEPKNPQMLAEKIQELINNPEPGQKLGTNAKQKAREEFSLERMIEKTKKVYL